MKFWWWFFCCLYWQRLRPFLNTKTPQSLDPRRQFFFAVAFADFWCRRETTEAEHRLGSQKLWQIVIKYHSKRVQHIFSWSFFFSNLCTFFVHLWGWPFQRLGVVATAKSFPGGTMSESGGENGDLRRIKGLNLDFFFLLLLCVLSWVDLYHRFSPISAIKVPIKKIYLI